MGEEYEGSDKGGKVEDVYVSHLLYLIRPLRGCVISGD